MGTTESNTPTTKRENQKKRQNRPQTEIAHRLSRAPTGSNITVAKCTNTVSFHLPCLMLLENKNSRGGREIVARVSHVDGPRRERRGRDSHFCFYLVLFMFGQVVLKGGGARGTLLQKRRQGAVSRARCDDVPVYRFVLCTSVSVISSPRVCL